MTTAPFNRPSFGSAFGRPFGKAFGPEAVVGFVPTDIASLFLWLDAAVGVSVMSGDVQFWLDQSGNNNTAFQASGPLRPFFDATGLNGFPSINFDGVDEFLQISDSSSIDITTDFTFYIVVTFPANGERNFLGRNGNAGYRWFLNTFGRMLVIVSGESDFSDTLSINTDLILEVRYCFDGVVNFTANGVDFGNPANSRTGITSNSEPLFIGQGSTGTDFYQGEMAQLVMYSTLLSLADRNNNLTYLGDRYNISTTPIT